MEARPDSEAGGRTAGDLKAGGFIPQRQPGKVTVRCKAPGGRLSADRLEAIASVARRYGSGIVHLSVRQSPEITGVDLADLDRVVTALAAAGQEIASCGKRYRVTVACGGCEINPNGLTPTQELALLATERFFGINTPHKFKTVFGGCPVDCVRARCADLGFGGMLEPTFLKSACTRCGLCVRACRDQALSLDDEGFPVLDRDCCVSCGACVQTCPFEALLPGRVGHGVYVGGKHGRHPHVTYPVAEFITDQQALEVIGTTLDWYCAQGTPGERIADTLDRVGLGPYRLALRPVVGERLLGAADLAKPKWRRLYPRGVAETFPPYDDLEASADG